MNQVKATNEIKELRKGCRKSRQAIPIEAVMLVVIIAVIWGLGRFFTIPFGIKVIVVGILLYSLVGDILNLYFSNRRLKKLDPEDEHDV